MKKITILFFFALLIDSSSFAKEYLPAPLLLLENNFSHHVVVAEKSTHKLHVFKNDDGIPQHVKTYDVATGKKAGNKIFQGDHRTPEGIYYLTEFLTHDDLVKKHGKQGEIYGVGAFVLNYPNAIDSIENKTGGGIWLHSTNDETRIDKGLDSRGCVVSGNTDLIEISQYLELHKTPMIIVHNLNYLNKSTWQVKRDEIENSISSWLKSWSEENIDEYINHYHENFSNKKVNGKSAYRKYKKSIFARAGKPSIEIKNLTILAVKDYVRATFIQEYKSNSIQDVGRKTIYLMRDDFYNWKIIAENWSKKGIDTEAQEGIVAGEVFTPSQRFFSTTNPSKIMGDKLLHARNLAN